MCKADQGEGTGQIVQGFVSVLGKKFGFILSATDFKHKGRGSNMILFTFKRHPGWRMTVG